MAENMGRPQSEANCQDAQVGCLVGCRRTAEEDISGYLKGTLAAHRWWLPSCYSCYQTFNIHDNGSEVDWLETHGQVSRKTLFISSHPLVRRDNSRMDRLVSGYQTVSVHTVTISVDKTRQRPAQKVDLVSYIFAGEAELLKHLLIMNRI
jgi:hypothetical protein